MNKFIKKMFRYLLDGMLVVLPFVITIALLMYPVNLVSKGLSKFFGSVFSLFLRSDDIKLEDSAILTILDRYCGPRTMDFLKTCYHIPYSNILLVLFIITLFGMIVSNVFIQSGVRLLERVLLKIPGVTLVYSYVKESVAAFVGKFNKPVLVTINRELGIQKLGFITQEDIHSIDSVDNLDHQVAVYLPHSYAFSGELMFFPREHVQLLNITPTMAWKVTLSGGLAGINQRLVNKEVSVAQAEGRKKLEKKIDQQKDIPSQK